MSDDQDDASMREDEMIKSNQVFFKYLQQNSVQNRFANPSSIIPSVSPKVRVRYPSGSHQLVNTNRMQINNNASRPTAVNVLRHPISGDGALVPVSLPSSHQHVNTNYMQIINNASSPADFNVLGSPIS